MEKILVPTDFSSCATKALDYAVVLAKKAGADLMVIHTCILSHNPVHAEQAMVNAENAAIQDNARMQLYAMRKSIEEAEGVTTLVRLYDGDFFETIETVSEEWKPDLIVMGTTGKSSWQNRLFGSKTAGLLSESNVPVLVVPGAYEWDDPKNILLALNDADEELQALQPAFDIARSFGAQVTVGLFSYEDEEAYEVMQDSRTLSAIGKKLQAVYPASPFTTAHLSSSSLTQSLQEYIDDHKINLLVMVTHRRKTIEQLFHKSLTRKMNYLTAVPLLSIPAEA